MSAEPGTDGRDLEIAALQGRVAQLEAELAVQARRTAGLLAESQEKLYWLERWHIDLDEVMARPGAIPTLGMLRRIRRGWRVARRVKRRMLGP